MGTIVRLNPHGAWRREATLSPFRPNGLRLRIHRDRCTRRYLGHHLGHRLPSDPKPIQILPSLFQPARCLGQLLFKLLHPHPILKGSVAGGSVLIGVCSAGSLSTVGGEGGDP